METPAMKEKYGNEDQQVAEDLVQIDIYGESGLFELDFELHKGTPPSKIQFSPVPDIFVDNEQHIIECRFYAWKLVGIKFSREDAGNISMVNAAIQKRVKQLLPPEDLDKPSLETVNWEFLQMAQFYKPY